MPRRSRLEIAGSPQLVLQRGVKGKPTFRCARDFRRYLEEMRISSASCDCVVHAYALLPCEVRLLVTGKNLGSVSRMMQSLGRRYSYCVNARDGSTGACWHGRYRSCPVDPKHALLASGYVELTPVEAGIVSSAAAYRWSSYACNALGIPNQMVGFLPGYLGLAEQDTERHVRYRELLTSRPGGKTLLMHIQQGRAWGDAKFLREVGRQYGDRGPVKPRGRPRKPRPGPEGIGAIFMSLSPFLLIRLIESVYTLGSLV